MTTNYAIIVAGGAGNRMKSVVPKQFMLLNGIPVMMHTIHAFYKSVSAPRVIAVLPPDLQETWLSLCEKYHFHVQHFIADGGNNRFESVKNGLAMIKSMDTHAAQGFVAVHDAVRPLITPSLIDLSYEEAKRTGAAALAIPSSNSVRLYGIDSAEHRAYPREKVYLMQTPQVFRGSYLFSAYEQPEDPTCTDDASIVEKTGIPITIVNGDTRNIKITFPDDLRIAELLFGTPKLGSSPNNPQ